MAGDELKLKTILLSRSGKKKELVVTATKVGQDTYCNIGIVSNGDFEALIATKVIKSATPAPHHLVRAIHLLEDARGSEIQGDMRLKMAVSFLSKAVYNLFD